MSPTVSVLELAAGAALVTVTWAAEAVASSSRTIVSAATLPAPSSAALAIAAASAVREFLETFIGREFLSKYVVVTVRRPAVSKPKLRRA
jgi:hypothetical protein